MSMRISELARATGVPLPTVKYYLREGLLPAGRSTAATQADYDQAHVDRLRLVRALVDVGGLSLTSVATVLSVLDAGADQLPYAIGEAHTALGPLVPQDRRGKSGHPPPTRALDLTRRLGWRVYEQAPALLQLDAALVAAEQVGIAPTVATVDRYAAAALDIAEHDIDAIPMGITGAAPGGPSGAVAHVVLATVLYEPILLALRRLAQAHVFTSRFDRPDVATASEQVTPRPA
jgi:DNA-binding transcriptional MerR regulator